MQGVRLATDGNWGGTPRSVAFNVHGFRVAVNTGTGELRILQSVQAADAGVVVNPRQCRGQIEGGIAQALGAVLYEEVKVDDAGRVTTDILRQYHIPSFADVPRSEVYFATTNDSTGPLGAKSMSESPFNPVAPALGQRHPQRNRDPLRRAAHCAGQDLPGPPRPHPHPQLTHPPDRTQLSRSQVVPSPGNDLICDLLETATWGRW